MDYEIEFLPVGDGTKAGDAIVARYGMNGRYEVTIVDGGTEDSGAELVTHVRRHYGRDTIVQHVVSTHPDSDHASGLRTVLKELPVANLWIHGLWHHTPAFMPFFANKDLTVDGVRRKIRSEYPIIDEIITLAQEKGIPISEPFCGDTIGPFTVLSPTRWVYDRLVPQFRKTPDPDTRVLESQQMYLGEVQKQSIFAALMEKALEKAVSWIPERWDLELLKEGGVTAAENETSTILWADFGTDRILLTGDAGVNALWWAADYAPSRGIDLQAATLVQVPHHGSRRNASPQTLDRILGPRMPRGSARRRFGVVSAPKDDANHPRKMVMNAYLRRGTPVHTTQGAKFRFHSGTMPPRPGEVQAVPFDFFDRVEAYD